jgi:SpoVK/Ycf46/Vps4 family AAA+-type ATPase
MNGEAAPQSLVFETTPRVSLADLILPEAVVSQCQEMVEEHHRGDLLRSHGLNPRHRLLFVGPPGNGKTSLAEALAHALAVPLYQIRYDGVVGSFLGETAGRLRKVFDFVRSRHCVLFFDEFDTLGKERADPQDTGEIKRVVSSLLLQVDELPAYVVVVTATNHPEILDRAVWRRFQIRLELPATVLAQRAEWFGRFERRVGSSLGQTPAQLARITDGASFSELRDFCDNILRRWVLAQPPGGLPQIVADQVSKWKTRFRSPAPA